MKSPKPPALPSRRRLIVPSLFFAVVVISVSIWFTKTQIALFLPVLVAALGGGLSGMVSKTLDHDGQTLMPYSLAEMEIPNGVYFLMRLALSIALGVAAAYVTQAYAPTVVAAPMLPAVAAFVTAYIFDATKVLLK